MTPERLAEIRKKVSVGVYYSDTLVRELLDHIAQLEAQRGGAVVVPPMTNGDCHAILSKHCGGNDMELRRLHEAYRLAVSRIQPIPADQVFKEGMVGVDREELMYLHAFEKYARKHGPESIQDVAGTLDHLRRAQQAKGE